MKERHWWVWIWFVCLGPLTLLVPSFEDPFLDNLLFHARVGVWGAIASIPLAVFIRRRFWRRLDRVNRQSSCLACSSHQVRVEGEQRICRICGYAGRADGGGALETRRVAHLVGDDPWVDMSASPMAQEDRRGGDPF